MKTKTLIVAALLAFSVLPVKADMLMDGDARMSNYYRERFNDDVLPALHAMSDAKDFLEGRERAGIIVPHDAALLAEIRSMEATQTGGVRELVWFFDSKEGRVFFSHVKAFK